MKLPTHLLFRSINHSFPVLIVTFLLTTGIQAFSFPQKEQQLTVKVVNYIINNHYDSAFTAIHRFPQSSGDPLPALLHLAVLGMRDVDFEQIIDSTRFLKSYDSASALLAAWESQKGKSSYTRMLSGMCKAIYAAFYIRQKRYVNAMKNGFSALDDLREAQELDSTNYEVDFFLGLYEYARAELRSRLWWVLFWYPGNRERGIEKVRRCAENAILTGDAAMLSLCDMYIQEKQSEDALKYLNILKKDHPSSRFVLWAEVKYLESRENFSAAAKKYGHLSTLYAHEQYGTFNTLTTAIKQATMLHKSGNNSEAITICNKLLHSNAIDDYKDLKKETVKLSERCNAADNR